MGEGPPYSWNFLKFYGAGSSLCGVGVGGQHQASDLSQVGEGEISCPTNFGDYLL